MIVAGVLGIIGLFWLSTMFAGIGTGTVGVVTSFGKVTGREMEPGLHIKAPYPFEAVTDFDIRVQKEEAEAQAATKDLQDVKAKLAVNYHLERGKVGHIFQNLGTDYRNRIIDPAVQEVFKASTAQFNAAELLTKRAEVKEVARKLLADRLEPRGIVLDDLSIVNFQFSDEFNKAIESKQVAQQEAERAGYELERARKQAEAQQAQRESLTAEILQKMAIEKWNGVMPTVVGANNVFGIPMNK